MTREINETKEQLLLNTLIETAPVLVVLTDPDGRITLFNRTCEELTGYHRSEVIGKTIPELFLPTEWIPVVLKRFENPYAPELLAPHENPWKTRTGEERLIEWRCAALPSPGHDRPCIMGIGIDITAQRKTTDALQTETGFTQSLINSLPGTVYLFDQNGAILRWNRHLETISGYTAGEIMKMNPLDFIAGSDRKQVAERIQEVFTQGVSEAEAALLTKEGKTIPYFFTGLRIVIDNTPCVVGIGLDITSQKKMEKELIKARQIESIGVMAGGIAHDFNNVLTAILGNISLAKIPLNPKEISYARLTDAERAILRAKDLTQQLITFSKGGAPVKEIASVQEIIKDSANFALTGSSVRCRFSFADDLWPAEVDKGQVSQVVHNMVINAEQAMPGGGIIQIQCENVTIAETTSVNLRPGRYIRVCIEDKGVGIPEENLSRIFDPYFTTKQKGTGFGLTTSFSIIKKHEGTITVDSKPGIGTAFCIYLPAAYEKSFSKQEGVAGLIPGKGRVLLMDDEEIIRDVAAQMLNHVGYHVETAADGAEAIALYQKEKESGKLFDAVILDLTIPGGMGGKETLARLREINPDIKAIVSSGYSDDPVMSDFKAHGFRGSLAKPYRMEEMSKALQRALKRGPTA